MTEDGILVDDNKTKRFGKRSYLVKWSPMLRRVVELAEATRPGRNWIFPTRLGNPYRDSSFRRQWAIVMRLYEAKTGDRFRAHDLRAMYVSQMLDRGQDPHTHRNAENMRRIYDRRRIIEVDPLA